MDQKISEQGNIEQRPVQAGFVDVAKNTETKRSLEILLGDKNLAPERAQAIREQIQAIDSGEVSVVAEEILKPSNTTQNASELPATNISPEILAAALNRDIDLVDISKKGAGFEAMQMLIEKGKRDALSNKN